MSNRALDDVQDAGYTDGQVFQVGGTHIEDYLRQHPDAQPKSVTLVSTEGDDTVWAWPGYEYPDGSYIVLAPSYWDTLDADGEGEYAKVKETRRRHD